MASLPSFNKCKSLISPPADAPTDYGAVCSNLVFSPCELEKCVNVWIIDDDVVEKDESLQLILEATSNENPNIELDPERVNGRITIQDDDGKYSMSKYMQLSETISFL